MSQKQQKIKLNLTKYVEKRREAEGKGEKERYTHLKAEFQRIARKKQQRIAIRKPS